MLCRAFLTLICLFAVTLHADNREMAEAGVNCGDERYEDFMRRLREKEAREAEMMKGAGEVHAQRAAKVAELKAVRKDYKRVKIDQDPRLEKEWLEQQKAMKEQLEVDRRRFVQRRDQAAKTHCYGRPIPEVLEYELQDY